MVSPSVWKADLGAPASVLSTIQVDEICYISQQDGLVGCGLLYAKDEGIKDRAAMK